MRMKKQYIALVLIATLSAYGKSNGGSRGGGSRPSSRGGYHASHTRPASSPTHYATKSARNPTHSATISRDHALPATKPALSVSEPAHKTPTVHTRPASAPSFTEQVASTATGYIIGNGISRALFGSESAASHTSREHKNELPSAETSSSTHSQQVPVEQGHVIEPMQHHTSQQADNHGASNGKMYIGDGFKGGLCGAALTPAFLAKYPPAAIGATAALAVWQLVAMRRKADEHKEYSQLGGLALFGGSAAIVRMLLKTIRI